MPLLRTPPCSIVSPPSPPSPSFFSLDISQHNAATTIVAMPDRVWADLTPPCVRPSMCAVQTRQKKVKNKCGGADLLMPVI